MTVCMFACCFLFSGVEAFAQKDQVPTDEAIIKNGESLFKDWGCNTCHAVDKKVVGPALKGVYDRRTLPWIYEFVRNSSKVIASGDAQAVAIYKEFNNLMMPNHELEDADILAIMSYVKNVEDNPVSSTPDAVPGESGASASTQGAIPSEYLNIIIIGLIVVLLLILLVLAIMIRFMQRYLKDKKDLSEDDLDIVDEKFDLMAFIKSPTVIGIITFLVIVLAAKNVIDGLYTVGVQQGYQPEQPIAFSHKIHAGDYEIACEYCHTGVEIAKSANIPSVNICMNCHSNIKTESLEIQKLYTAQETGQPIEWVRVHNLPDLAYFNHSQHVKVGQVECQTCHGNIEEMEVVKQFAPLTMGWCIDCHRKTDLNTQGNGYYDKLVEMHNKVNGEKDKMKVEDIGGLECSKCHY